jgi:hypothetical protein
MLLQGQECLVSTEQPSGVSGIFVGVPTHLSADDALTYTDSSEEAGAAVYPPKVPAVGSQPIHHSLIDTIVRG